MSISNFAELSLLNALRGVSYSAAGTYVKLHTGDSGEDGTANAAANTTRQSVTFAAAASGAMASTSTPTWTNVPNTETYSHWSLWDASTAGNCLWTGAFTSSASVVAGDTFQITSLTLTLD
jgi:hypothetical protein